MAKGRAWESANLFGRVEACRAMLRLHGFTSDAEDKKIGRRIRRWILRRRVRNPWFNLREGNVCYGRLLGRHVTKTDLAIAYYKIELKQPCLVSVDLGRRKIARAKIGDIVNLGETYRTQVLSKKALLDGNHDVWILVGKGHKFKGGKSIWAMDIQVKAIETEPKR